MRGFVCIEKTDLPKIDAIYDCKALIALSSTRRKQYVDHLVKFVNGEAKILLLVFESPNLISGPPFVIDEAEINQLYSPYFNIKELERKSDSTIKAHLAKKGLTEKTEIVYLLEK